MTRINVGIPPKELSQKHLLAEHREIKRIPNIVAKGKANLSNIPQTFTLGEGHVRFFYNKLSYLLKRYNEIYKECKSRNLNVTCYHNAWENVPENLMGNYTPTEEDIAIIRARIRERTK